MNSAKKDDPKDKDSLDLVTETKKTIIGAKDWLLEDAELMRAYWHHKMGYMEAWVAANWHTVIDNGSDAIHELDEIEDAGLLWLIDHVNQNPVPLAECHVAGSVVPKGTYVCMSCKHEQAIVKKARLAVCELCHYGIFSTHDRLDQT